MRVVRGGKHERSGLAGQVYRELVQTHGPSDDEDDLEKNTRCKASKRDRDLDKWIKLVFVPRVRKISKPRPYWASLSAKADDPQCNMTLKEFTWSFTEILRSQPHAWRIP